MNSREAYKGHDRVINAMPGLVAQGYDVLYAILGEGDDRARLEKLAENAGVSDRVKFMGAVDRETLVEAYRDADLFVMPSTGEGFGIAYLEAMACGTPALGLAVAGACDALADGELGIVASQETLAEGISNALNTSRDSKLLADTVQARFGQSAFANLVRRNILRLLNLPQGVQSTNRFALTE